MEKKRKKNLGAEASLARLCSCEPDYQLVSSKRDRMTVEEKERKIDR